VRKQFTQAIRASIKTYIDSTVFNTRHAQAFAHARAHTHTHTHTHTDTHTHTHTQKHKYKHTYAYTHTHTNILETQKHQTCTHMNVQTCNTGRL